MQHISPVVAAALVFVVTAAAGNELGREEIVLPGYSPVHSSAQRAELGGQRSYDWGLSLLPAAISARQRVVASGMELVIRSGGISRLVPAAAARRVSGSDFGAVWSGVATMAGGLSVTVNTRVEYDGVAVVDVTIAPGARTFLDGVDVQFAVPRDPDLRIMGFEPATMYLYEKKMFVPECYQGAYRSALGFIYGEASFWWFTDDIDLGDASHVPVTTMRCEADRMRVVQPLVTTPRVLDAPLHLRFGFLATPVRDLPGALRRDRIAATVSAPEAKVGNRNLWWVEATAHYALPYLDYPPGVRARLPAADLRAYAGADRNRESVKAWRNLGIERLPYVSLRAISPLDPVVEENLDRWRVLPALSTDAEVDDPYRTAFQRVILSHRGPGFSDYLLGRLDEIVDGLQVRGFYFDQATLTGSANPVHLGQSVPSGGRAATTDILATREFFRRLATLIYRKGLSPLIYAHNSSAPLAPAFTFVTGMVQGEELAGEMKSLDYQATFDLDRLRATYAPNHLGITTVWLEELWSDRLAAQRSLRYRWATQNAWLESEEYARNWRAFMALALLHDIPVLTLAPVEYRRRLYGQLDKFGVADSQFLGYWQLNRKWRGNPVLISAYLHDGDDAVLLVVANVSGETQRVSSREIRAFLAQPRLPPALTGLAAANADLVPVEIPAHDFALVELR